MYKPNKVIPISYSRFVKAWFGRLTKVSLEHSFKKAVSLLISHGPPLIYLCNLSRYKCIFPVFDSQIDQSFLAF